MRDGSRTAQIYETLRDLIVGGELPPGGRLPPHRELAARFEVAPMTIRQVLARLADERLVSREPGRGTFALAPAAPTVLIVAADGGSGALLAEHVRQAGYRPLTAGSPADGLAALLAEPQIALVLSDVRLPEANDGIGFIRSVRAGWPGLPLAAMPSEPRDLDLLRALPECPSLIVARPFLAYQIAEVLRLTLQEPYWMTARPVSRVATPARRRVDTLAG